MHISNINWQISKLYKEQVEDNYYLKIKSNQNAIN